MKRMVMKRMMVVALATVISMAILAGCQPRPGRADVIGKDLEQMLALAISEQDTAGSLAERLGVPGRYESYVEDAKGSFKVTIDADVILPEADSIPLVWVKAQPFDQQIVNKLIAALFNDGKLYAPDSMSELTKSEISDLLTQLKLKKTELEQQGMKPLNPDSNDNVIEVTKPKKDNAPMEEAPVVRAANQLDLVNEGIRMFEERLQTAPDEKEFVEVSGDFEAQDILRYAEEKRKEYAGKLFNIAHVGQPNPEGGMRSLFVVNNESRNSYTMQYINRKDFDMMFGQYYTETIWNEITNNPSKEHDRETANALPSPTISADQAQDIAEQFLEQIGVDYLVCERKDKVIGGSSSEYAHGTRTGNLLKAYRLQYVRQVGGVPVTYTRVETAGYGEDSTIWFWDYEKMTFIVNDSGIVEMLWEAPYKLAETVTNNTAILPFSQIREVFEKMIVIDNAYYRENRADMNITEVRLGLMRIIEQNNQARGLLVPVWDFLGTRTAYFEDDGQLKSYTHKDAAQSWLTINAIDGSVIDRSSGY